jgi:DNA primase
VIVLVVKARKRKNRDRKRCVIRDTLAELGVSVAQMIDAGLLVHGEDVAVPYDRFRGRVFVFVA